MSDTRLTPALVVDTAADLADELGLDAVTMTRVAEALGVRQPALYRHVASHGELTRSLSLRARYLLASRLAEAGVGQAGDDAVRAMAHAWRGFVQDHPGLYEATDRCPSVDDTELEAAIARLVELLSKALDSYGLDQVTRVTIGNSLRSAIHGFCHLESNREHPLAHDLDTSFDQLIDLLCAGISARFIERAKS